MTLRNERFIDRARRSHQRAGDDQHRVVEREADASRRPPGVAVQHRNHHRHIGPANRNDDQDTKQECDARQVEKRRPLLSGNLTHEQDAVINHHQSQREIDPVLEGIGHWRAGKNTAVSTQPGELAEGDDRA
jgi:hypothetical protein